MEVPTGVSIRVAGILNPDGSGVVIQFLGADGAVMMQKKNHNGEWEYVSKIIGPSDIAQAAESRKG